MASPQNLHEAPLVGQAKLARAALKSVPASDKRGDERVLGSEGKDSRQS